MLSLKQNHNQLCPRADMLFHFIIWHRRWYFFNVFECSLSLAMRRVPWHFETVILAPFLTPGSFRRFGYCLCHWLCYSPTAEQRTPGLRGSKPQPSTTELRALQTQPPRPWDKLEWQFWTFSVSEANFILLPRKRSCKAPLPIHSSLEGSWKGPRPLRRCWVQNEYSSLFTGPCKVNTAS